MAFHAYGGLSRRVKQDEVRSEVEAAEKILVEGADPSGTPALNGSWCLGLGVPPGIHRMATSGWGLEDSRLQLEGGEHQRKLPSMSWYRPTSTKPH